MLAWLGSLSRWQWYVHSAVNVHAYKRVSTCSPTCTHSLAAVLGVHMCVCVCAACQTAYSYLTAHLQQQTIDRK